MLFAIAFHPENEAGQSPNGQEQPPQKGTRSGERQPGSSHKKACQCDREKNLLEFPKASKDEFDSDDRSEVRRIGEEARTPLQLMKESPEYDQSQRNE